MINISKELLAIAYDRVWQIATDKYIGMIGETEEFLITPAFTIKVNSKVDPSYIVEFPSMQLNCIVVDRHSTFKDGWWLEYIEPTKRFKAALHEDEVWDIVPEVPGLAGLSHLTFWGWKYGEQQINNGKHRAK